MVELELEGGMIGPGGDFAGYELEEGKLVLGEEVFEIFVGYSDSFALLYHFR